MLYFADFEGPAGGVVQAVVTFPYAQQGKVWYPPQWFDAIQRLCSSRFAVPDIQVAVRCSLRRGKVEQCIIFIAPEKAKNALSGFVSRFFELLAYVPDSVELPLDRSAHDKMTYVWPTHVCRLDASVGGTSQWYACPFRIRNRIGELLDEALSAHRDLFYQAMITPWFHGPEEERVWKRRLIEMQAMGGVPERWLNVQKACLSWPTGSALLVEEYVGTTGNEGRRWLVDSLTRLFRDQFGFAAPPEFSFEENPFAPITKGQGPLNQQLELGIHSAQLRQMSDAEVSSQMIGTQDAKAWFDWSQESGRILISTASHVVDKLRQSYDAALQEDVAEAMRANQVLKSMGSNSGYAPDKPFTFVSYKRADIDRVGSLVSQLDAANLGWWMDSGIPGGASWIDCLQDRIQKCSSVTLCLTKEAAGSRYVQHEIKYAFSLGKNILPVAMEPIDLVQLPGGLGMILSPLQTVAPHGIVQALRSMTGSVRT